MNKTPTYPVGTIAKLLMLSERRIQDLAATGVIPKAERGRYELVPVVQGYIKFLQERTLGSGKAPVDYHTEKARLTKLQADIAELQVQRERGESCPVDQVERAVSKAFAEVRAGMRNIPGRVVSMLIGEMDEREFKRVLLQEIDDALATLAMADVLAPEPDADDDEADGTE